jgi:hypothetical protein
MRSTIACSLTAAAIALLTFGGATPARAEPTPAERAMAEGLFKEGKRLLARGKVAEACEKLASSYHIDPAGGTLLNLGACHELQGKTATAWAEFNDALALANKGGRAERQKAAREHIASLEPKLARVTVTTRQPSGASVGLEVKLDGIVMAPGALGTGIPVDPGEHTATATAPGKVPWETKLTIKESESKSVEVPPLDDVPAPPPEVPPPPPGLGWKKPLGGAAVGLGAVGLGIGAAFGVRAVVLGGQVASACHGGLCTQAGLDAANEGKTAANVSNALIPIGVLLAGGGVALLLLSSSPSSSPPDRPAAASTAARVRAFPVVGPGLAVLEVGGVL